ncbi:LPXTG cell wall anchor domain-containing protein [Listeria aquatica]|uniref:LPXTG cell wall anchor domain-containing protein n=1 Tax=Listeria aquatica TaxID=1494960 RepID=A0A841ZP85_9LIST|nr:WxL domain-containing protein [Listeria aquatica]MBC1521168.1 LPXTG cell wall anchor domain-containing protein [Listeria aquatica]
MKKVWLCLLLGFTVSLLIPSHLVSATGYESTVGLTLTGEQPKETPKGKPSIPEEKAKPENQQKKPFANNKQQRETGKGGKPGYKAGSGTEKLPLSQLPHTGDTQDWQIIWAGLLLIVGIFFLLRKKNRKFGKVTLILLGSGFLLFPIFNQVSASGIDSISSSRADAYYKPNYDHTKPLNPVQPNEKIQPKSANPGTPGPLSIDFASNIQFGSHEITGQTETYFAALTPVTVISTGQSEEVPNYVQVTDNRGTLGGYRLTVKQNGQLKSGKAVLQGAEIIFLNSTLRSMTNKKTPRNFQKIVLDATGESASDVIVAKAGTGAGTWLNIFGGSREQARKSIQVVLPKETRKQAGHYRTTLTWEMIDSPY